VVIWDAQNETVLAETGKAIGMVRQLDLSGRPWENGYSAPDSPGDLVESHPYMFNHSNQHTFCIRPPWDEDAPEVSEQLPEGGWLKNELSISPELFGDANNKDPDEGGERYPNAYLVNEYGWIWLYRDGSPAWAASEVWKAYPGLDTPEKRFEWRARVIAAKTEYWRSRREIAGVHHFCALTCDRPQDIKSQVSDDWLDVPGLIMQPIFEKYVKPAFAPVGIMIEKWDDSYLAGALLKVPVVMYNDLYSDWKGEVNFRIMREDEEILSLKREVRVKSLGLERLEFDLELPVRSGSYEMIAAFTLGEQLVFSSRLFSVGVHSTALISELPNPE